MQIFKFEATQVRTVERDGQLYFVLADICKVLELSNNRIVAGS